MPVLDVLCTSRDDWRWWWATAWITWLDKGMGRLTMGLCLEQSNPLKPLEKNCTSLRKKWGWVHILKFQKYKVANLCWKDMQCSRSCTPLAMTGNNNDLFVLFTFSVFGSRYHAHLWYLVSWWCSATLREGRSWVCIVSGSCPKRGVYDVDRYEGAVVQCCRGESGTLDWMEGVPWRRWVSAVIFANLIEKREAEIFHQRDGTLVWDGERRIFQSTSNIMAPTKWLLVTDILQKLCSM